MHINAEQIKLPILLPRIRVWLDVIRMYHGQDGIAMEGDLYMNNVHIAYVHDRADGGCYSYHIYDKKMFAELKAEIAKLPPLYIPAFDHVLKLDMDLFLSLLQYEQENTSLKN
jgi:hypothetical protein